MEESSNPRLDHGRLTAAAGHCAGSGQIILELPGGALDEQDASILNAAQRELREETGYVGEVWRETETLWASPNNLTNTIHCILAFGARYVTEPQREPCEHIEVARSQHSLSPLLQVNW